MDKQHESPTSRPTMKAVVKEHIIEETGNAPESNSDTPVEDTLIDESPLIIPPGMADDEDKEAGISKTEPTEER